MNYYGVQSGDEIIVSCIWTGMDGTVKKLLRRVRVTGEDPVPPTVDTITGAVKLGGMVRLTGFAGDATSLTLEGVCTSEDRKSEVHVNQPVEIQQDGTWTAEFATELVGDYYLNVRGRRYEQQTGNISAHAYVYDDTMLPAPAVDIPLNMSTGSFYSGSFTAGAGDENSYITWEYSSFYHNGQKTWYNTDRVYGTNYGITFQNEVAEKVTMTVRYQLNGIWSKPTVVDYSFEGNPWPTQGKVPCRLEVPETWKASMDLSFDWKPEAEGQKLLLTLTNMEEAEVRGEEVYYQSLELSTEGTITFPGYRLTPGNYTLAVFSNAPDYLTTSRSYLIIVEENERIPDAPKASMTPETPTDVTRITTYKLDQVYDAVSVAFYRISGTTRKFWGADSAENTDTVSSEWADFTLSAEYTWEAEVRAMIDGVWSEPAVIPFTVTEAPQLNEFIIDYISGVIDTETDLQLTLKNLDSRAEQMYVYAGRLSFAAPVLGSEMPLTIPVDELEIGSNRVRIVLLAEGYRFRDNLVYITVNGERPTPVLKLPSELAEIEPEAFMGTKAQKIVIPSGCEKVGTRAFASSSSLTEVVVEGKDTVISSDAFYECGEITLKVYKGSRAEETFRNAAKITIEYLDE